MASCDERGFLSPLYARKNGRKKKHATVCLIFSGKYNQLKVSKRDLPKKSLPTKKYKMLGDFWH